jgi:4'-phosphopantetheinyl transferase
MDFNFKMKSKQCLTLKLDDVHIWSVCLLDNERDIYYLSSLLSKDEEERAGRFRFPRDQERFIITRGILRCLLAGYLEETPQAIEIMYGLWGKPCLSKEKSLHFNVSHSGDYAVFAFTRDYEVGIDLERIDKNIELEEMALIIFSQAELNYWEKLHPEEKVDFFFKVWVKKEAFLKALGKGWLENDEKIKFEELYSFEQNLDGETSKNELGFLHYFQCVSGYTSAFFAKGPILEPTYFNWK